MISRMFTCNQVLRHGIHFARLPRAARCVQVETRVKMNVRRILPSHNNWRRGGHDTTIEQALVLMCTSRLTPWSYLRGAAAVLGVVAPVECDPLAPVSAVGSIQAKE